MDNQPTENPFAGMMAAMRRSQSQQAPQGAGGGMPMQGQAPQGPEVPPEDNQFMRGQGAGNSQFLIGAVQQLQKYITNSTDPTEIQIARNIVMLLNKLVEKEQEAKVSEIGELGQGMQEAPMSPPPQQGFGG